MNKATGILVIVGLSMFSFAQMADEADVKHQYSEEASELIEYYTPRITEWSRANRNPYWSPDLAVEHLTEKYRSAWDELILALTKQPYDYQAMKISPHIYAAICRMAKPESVPVLAKALRQTTAKDVDQKKVIRTQEWIYNALSAIPDTNTLDVILTSLDSLDEVYGSNKPVRTSIGVSLREKVFSSMINTNSSSVAMFRMKENERADAWKPAIMQYNRSKKLSPNNRGLLKRIEVHEKAKTAKP